MQDNVIEYESIVITCAAATVVLRTKSLYITIGGKQRAHAGGGMVINSLDRLDD